MFNKILIANRGEIACRVMRTAKSLGIATVAVYSEADAEAAHVIMADEAFYLGEAPSKDSYLRGDRIIDIAERCGAEAIHPGYGFLSENAAFARACEKAGIAFIGPPATAIDAMGSKSAAKTIMEAAGVPLVPGYHGADQSPALLRKEAERIGFPVLLKAVAGGGGKGMRVVWSAKEFDEALQAAQREGKSAFGNGDVLVEKYLTKPRHVEIQVFADSQGNCVYLAERDCSIQRRHQKVLEEAPAPGMTPELRTAMGEAAVKAAEAIGYVGAGTVEFLLDEDGSFYFMEMNTRLQVEHPVTEMITGQDLVKWQLLVACGQPLPLKQEQIKIHGHAMEVRIYAEDPDNDFLPATGKLTYLRIPDASNNVRIDTGVRENDVVSVYYDPMIAKLIVWDENRDRAIQRLQRALADYRIDGVKTNLKFLTRLAEHSGFAKADLDTGFIERYRADLLPNQQQEDEQALALAALYSVLSGQQKRQRHAAESDDPNSPWHTYSAWRLNARARHQLQLACRGKTYHAHMSQKVGYYLLEVEDGPARKVMGVLEGDQLRATLDGHSFNVNVAHRFSDEGEWLTLFNGFFSTEVLCQPQYLHGADHHEQEASLTAPMNGTVVALLCQTGQEVEPGTGLIVIEAMKMEHTLRAPARGVVKEFYFEPGDLVSEGIELLEFVPAGDADAEEAP
ncbi:acetyl-CoA carboxylase biotin carboxylase subunit [Balneatrix alpica]|uniref:acetyl-CoA carboxylase biotin carboxylase subunit n=1 Tax=Balneatrix alpica TaxID=75684 RepID=UPI002739C8CA|nr:acetyl-CoA carboxylase biotin carboxylase subunit [Balneatrix alpica]